MSANEGTRRTRNRSTFEIAVLVEKPGAPGMLSNILGTRAKFDTERAMEEFLPDLLRAFRRGTLGQPTPGDPGIRGPGALVYQRRGLTAVQLAQQFPDLAREAVEPIPPGAEVIVELIHRPE